MKKQQKALILAICGISLVVGTATDAVSAPVMFGANYYDLILVPDPFTDPNNTWDTASAAAAGSTYLGLSGHLATVTSAAENAVLSGLATAAGLSGFSGAWLGGKAPEGWLTGPESGDGFTYTNWAGPEPNNSGYVYMSIGSGHAYSIGTWVDDSFTQGSPDPVYDPVVGYFVEYEAMTTVPEPSSAVVLVLGIGGAVWARRRRRAQRGPTS